MGDLRPEQRQAKYANSRKDFGILQGTQRHVIPVRPNPTSSQAEVVASGEWTRLDDWGIGRSRTDNWAAKLPPLIGVPATNTPKDRKTGHGMSLHKRVADRARRRAQFPGRTFQALDFLSRPVAKTPPLRIVAAPEFIAFATDPALACNS